MASLIKARNCPCRGFMLLHFEDRLMAHPRLHANEKRLPAEPLVPYRALPTRIRFYRSVRESDRSMLPRFVEASRCLAMRSFPPRMVRRS